MAGYRESFSANVDYAAGRGGRDIAGSLQRGMSSLTGGGGALGTFLKQAQASRRGIQDLNNEVKRLDAEFAFANSVAQFRSLNKQISAAEENLKRMKKAQKQLALDGLVRVADKATKSLISMNASILGMGFNFLISSIKRVYELQERWTKAIGGFNLRLGGMTAGLKGAQKAATAWSSTIRGLTDGDINEGIQMFADFTDAIGRVVEKGDDFQRFGLLLARGFNLGGQGAGQLTKVFENIGNNGASAAETMKDMAKSANAAHVPVNLLAKDMVDSSVYMARFGKEGQKTFVQGAAWARKFTISMEQLRNSVEGLDMFDEAAKTASKLNATFGTMINSMDLMMEDDPAKRLEMIRQQFLAQGTTFEKMTVKQRRYLSETLKLTEDQVGALLKAENAGQSYADFQEKAAKKEKNELSAKQMMEKQLRATAQTMYAFGAAFDRITVAIANAIKPLLVVLGLASDGDKKFGSFGQVMESITVTVEEFFNSLARNEKWNVFMVELAGDMRKAGAALRDFVMDGRAADLIGDIAGGMKTFYVFVRDLAIKVAPALRPLLNIFLTLSQHLDKIAIAWGALKGIGMVGSLVNGPGGGGSGGGIAGMLGGRGVLTKGSIGGKIGGAASGMVAGGAAGAMMGGVGAGVGGLVGGLLGPIGGIIGAAAGKLIEMGIDVFFPKKKSEIEIAREQLVSEQERLAASTKKLEERQKLLLTSQVVADVRRKAADADLQRLRSKKVGLEQVDLGLLRERASQLVTFRSKNKDVVAGMESLKNGLKPTNAQINALVLASQQYNTRLSELRVTAQQLADIQRSDVEFRRLEIDVQKTELEMKRAALDATARKEVLDKADKTTEEFGGGKAIMIFENVWDPVAKKWQKESISRLDLEKQITNAELKKINLEKKLEQDKFSLAEKQFYVFARMQMLQGDEFLQFMEAEKSSGKSRGVLEQDFLRKKFMGDGTFDEATRSGILGLSKFAKGGVVTRPTIGLVGEAGPEMILPLNRTNYAQQAGNIMGGTNVVTQIADVHLDGQKVGRAIVRTAITGRN